MRLGPMRLGLAEMWASRVASNTRYRVYRRTMDASASDPTELWARPSGTSPTAAVVLGCQSVGAYISVASAARGSAAAPGNMAVMWS